jgi:hypothetical protein
MKESLIFLGMGVTVLVSITGYGKKNALSINSANRFEYTINPS